MTTILLKPRWEAWENLCIQKAYAEKIQHKIIALALGRTVSSVSKKIKHLGLRAPSKVSGRIKGTKQILSKFEKTPQDLFKMIDLLQTYAPLSCFQKGELALRGGFWSSSSTPLCTEENKELRFSPMVISNSEFSFRKPLDYVPVKNHPPKKIVPRILSKKMAYVSLCYIENWADSKGFHKLRGELSHRGLSYWKDGTYFSQTQLLMYVNRLRFKHQLQPLSLIEEERESPA